MGLACFKANRNPAPTSSELLSAMLDEYVFRRSDVITAIADQIVQDANLHISYMYSNDYTHPHPTTMIETFAEHDYNWINLMLSMIELTPCQNPLGSSAITIIFSRCALPSIRSINLLLNHLRLSKERALAKDLDISQERNICIILGCIIQIMNVHDCEKLLSEDILEYLMTFVVSRTDPNLVLFALLALEKLAQIKMHKIKIQARLNEEPENPLLALESKADCYDYTWRQVGTCAKWILDYMFEVNGRPKSRDSFDVSPIKTVLRSLNSGQYLKICPTGLEVRSDNEVHETVISTMQVTHGCWYYECTVLTPGVIKIGWTAGNSSVIELNDYAIGDDCRSIGYDGCRQLICFGGTHNFVDLPRWQPGDVVGCLLDINNEEIIYSLNGTRMDRIKSFFNYFSWGFYAAASFMAFQQCRFNFGHEPFRFPPTDRQFCTFNQYGRTTEEEIRTLSEPRSLQLLKLKDEVELDNPCILCYSRVACTKMMPCDHEGMCYECVRKFKTCPICRSILYVIRIKVGPLESNYIDMYVDHSMD